MHWILFPIEDLRQVVETEIEMIVMTEAGTGLKRGHFPENYSNNRTRSTSNSRSRSGSRASTNRDRIHCYKCREYDHFAKDCPTSREENEIEQLLQMLNLGDKQTSISPPNTQDNFSRTSSEQNLRAGHLNL